jgi:hypothetical protein
VEGDGSGRKRVEREGGGEVKYMPIMSWWDLYAVTQAQQNDIRKYTDEIVALRAENARLRAAGAAGAALAKEAVQWLQDETGWRCIGCGAFHDIFELVEHSEGCRTRVFTEEKE